MRRIIFFLLLFTASLFVAKPALAANELNLYLFHSESCPHCRDERAFLSEMKQKYDWLVVNEYEVSEPETKELLGKTTEILGTQVNGVPFTVVCGQYFTGFQNTSARKNNLEKMLVNFHEGECSDPLVDIVGQSTSKDDNLMSVDTVSVPLLGELVVKDLSLPVFTFIIALLDGFNPCAMWVLIFLIGLLVGMKDKFKMWTLGGAFILASGAMYFMFLAAWLHLFLFLGFIKWVRVAIGIFALAAGIYYLRDYQKNKAGACKISGGNKHKKVFARLKSISQNKSFVLALLGIILLAFAVNLVELVCSAGLPAVYTQVLSLTPMPKWQYYLYLLFYIFIFMLDDLVVYIVAMKTLHTIGIDGKYARFSHLVGGLAMLAIGLAMLFKPELLMFG